MIKYIVTDVDGVLTDGKITLDVQGRETRTVCYRDLDAIGMGRREGFSFIFVTGEQGEMAQMLAACQYSYCPADATRNAKRQPKLFCLLKAVTAYYGKWWNRCVSEETLIDAEYCV